MGRSQSARVTRRSRTLSKVRTVRPETTPSETRAPEHKSYLGLVCVGARVLFQNIKDRVCESLETRLFGTRLRARPQLEWDFLSPPGPHDNSTNSKDLLPFAK